MKNKIILSTILVFIVFLLASCQSNYFNHEHVWSKYYDNGDGTHTRTCLKDINHKETSPHNYILDSIIKRASDVAPGEEKYKCDLCGAVEIKVIPPTGNYTFDQKVVDDKYLYKRYSEHYAIYYMSSKEGAYGNINYLFENSDLSHEYTEVDYLESDGTQYINTLIDNDDLYRIIRNGESEYSIPQEYEEVEYIQSTGTQYIDSGYQIKSEKIKIAFKAYIPFLNGLSLFGSNDSNYDLVPYHSTNYNPTSFLHWVGSSQSVFEVVYDNFINEVEYVLDNGIIQCTVNGKTTNSMYEGSIISNQKFYIFGKNEGEVSKERGQGYRLYSFKLYDNDILVRDYLPCYRKSDGEIGLYDKVSGELYVNSGSGEFLKGKEIKNNNEDYSMIVRYDLPEGYNQLAYINSSGIQSLKTGVFGASKVELIGSFSNNNGTQMMGYNRFTGYSFGINQSGCYTLTNESFGGKDTIVWDASNNKISLTVNDIVLYDTEPPISLGNEELKLFAIDEESGCCLKLYNAKIYQDDILVRHFIPAKSTYTNTAGLYDLINNKFYESSSYTPFECGSNFDLDIDVSKINIFASRDYGEKILLNERIHDYLIYDANDCLVRNFVSCIRNSDGKAGLYDVVDRKFYTNEGGNEFKKGKIIGHVLDEGKITTEPSYSNDGLIVYTCSLCGEQIYETIPKTSYKVSFVVPESINGVKIFRTNDPDDFEISNIGYTRNLYTYNYSKYGASIDFEIIPSGNYEYEIKNNNGILERVSVNKYRITNITNDTIVEIVVNKPS